MKKIIIITAILLFGISVHAQRAARERTRQTPEKQKSETAVRRSAEQKNSRAQQAHSTRQATARDISHASRSRTNQANGHAPGRATTSKDRAMKSRYEKPVQGQVHRGNTVHRGRTSGGKAPNNGSTGTYRGQKPAGSAGRYHGNKSPGNKGTVQSNNQGHRNSQSIRGNTGHSRPAARTHAEHRMHYATPNRRVVRTDHAKNYHYSYNPVRYRNVHYHYHAPKRVHVTWTNRMYHDYRIMYPEYGYWYYPIGYQIVTIPFYQAYHHVGEVRNVYGRVHEVYYSWSTDEYHLYFGGNYPYHDFTVIISGRHARRFHNYPEMFFEGRYMWVTGLLSTFEGRPELIVKRRHQIHLY